MRLLMIASSTPVGLTYHLTRLSIALKRTGHDVIVLSSPMEQEGGLSAELLDAGIEHFKSEHIDNSGICAIYKSKREIRKILKRKDLDVIHSNGVIHATKAYLALKSLHKNRKPVTVTSIHAIPEEGFLQRPKWGLMKMILTAGSNMILPVSNNTRESLVKHGLNAQKIIVVHNGIDLETFDDLAVKGRRYFGNEMVKKPAIANAGSLIPRKGQENYLMAAAEVLKKCSAKFYIVGGGPQRRQLEELAQNLGIRENVIFTGRISWPELYYLLSNVADICVSASLGELFPFYILECMAAAKPIVTTDVGGVSEAVIDGVNGYLVPPRNPSSLAKSILNLLNNPDKARQMGQKGRELAKQNFSMDIVCKKLGKIYRIAQSNN